MDFEAPNEWRYYKLNALTKELNSMVRYEAQVENIVRNMSARKPNNSDLPELSAEVVQSALDEERKYYAWMNEDFTMQDIANWIYTDADALLVFAQAAKHYADSFKDFGYVKQAQLYAIKVCNYLSKLGYDRSQVTLGMIKTYAEKFWRNTLERRVNGAPVILPEVRWPDIFKSLGLDDLPSIPSGRPPKNLPERDVPGFASKHPKRRPRGRS